mmetsp:Transcript_39919/g.85046  ORF Transcript_39919/g.85046 Transcript_39919/m.85046 type:complete len:383 (-) Transcript_39919:4-1152(-)|eukprot:CAMPEP_0172551510 /NCGR_PEP_ID=MMETSP1067-20121228/40047_1 /TAXON_ID=265564 ORGANISM="Thalassiosira punctigera, Strain Tpunct2005C2" /NCGR_SAMPLE_ID=MMETSP1067 /ASSEMBLY_ACC=CAM_ASM_000444 /LENGTH=382 /DNA_ID=CAMNT_0013339311 /DNA_START=225 /DNA_END=1369 /DNA_ORIENTATION=+
MMLQRLPTHNPPVRIVLQQLCQQVGRVATPQRVHRHEVSDRPFRPLRKLWVVVRQPVHAVPVRVGIGRTPPLENFDELVDVRPAWEEGETGGHLGEDAADGPDVDGGGVAGGAEEEFGGAVPEGDDLVGVGSVREAGEAGEAEVCEFQGVSVGTDQEVVRLQIPVQHPVGVTVPHPVQYLPHEAPHHRLGQPDPLPNVLAPLPLVHERLEIVRHVLENQVESPGRGLDDVEQLDDVVVRKLAQEGDLADDVARHAPLGGGIGVRDALDGDRAVRGALRPAVDGAVGSLPYEVSPGVTVQRRLVVGNGLGGAVPAAAVATVSSLSVSHVVAVLLHPHVVSVHKCGTKENASPGDEQESRKKLSSGGGDTDGDTDGRWSDSDWR